MTWNKSDTIGKGNSPAKARGPRVPAEPVEAPQELLDADGEPTMSVFAAMQVETQGIWGAEAQRFPQDVEAQLSRELGIIPERHWQTWKRFVYRNIEAV